MEGSSEFHAAMTSVPSLTRELMRSGRSVADSAGRMRTRLTPCGEGVLAGVELGQHAAGDDGGVLRARGFL